MSKVEPYSKRTLLKTKIAARRSLFYLLFLGKKRILKSEVKVLGVHLMTKKQQFLSEHNRLASLDMQATASMLTLFKIEKASLFKDKNWSIDKLRRPFIFWLTSLTPKEKEDIVKVRKA